MRKSFIAAWIIAAGLWTVSLPANADEIGDTIKEALNAYEKGDITQAKEDLQYALELLKQASGGKLKSFFPEPLEGWKASEIEDQSQGAAMLGGGVFLHRTYKKGDAEVTIEFVSDSPVVQSVGMMLANPMFAGGALKRIHREKALIEYRSDEKKGKLTIIVNNKVMISIEGEGVSKEDLIAYAKAIDIEGMKKL
jgi:hypothetical protein